MTAMEHMTGAPKIEYTVFFSSWMTPIHPTMKPVPALTLIPPEDDESHSRPSLSPTPTPTSSDTQPFSISHPDPHIGPTLILPDDHPSTSQPVKLCSNIHGPHEDVPPNRGINHTPDYADDPRSRLPATQPIVEYFELPTLEYPSNEDTDERETSTITHQAELIR